MTTALSTMNVGDIEGQFRICAYQRGYRWGRHEVHQLLEDIWESKGQPYRLQPIVVRAIGENEWELIDGQQRLTTLYLIYLFMQRSGLKKFGPQYSIVYDTRNKSAEFLRAPDSAQAEDNIDFHFLYAAYAEIEAWFGPDEHKQQERADKLFIWLKDGVEVIRYETGAEEDPIALFARLNVGRIPLTDAELVKAHLLTQVQAPQHRADRAYSVAAQWDGIERDLRRPDIWAFISNRQGDDYPTRITLLLDTLADQQQLSDAQHGQRQTFEKLRAAITRDPMNFWNAVVELHARVLGWFEDHHLYHRIGFLIASGDSFGEILTLARGKLVSEFTRALVGRIGEKLDLSRKALAELSYEGGAGRNKCQQALLLMNVETIRHRDMSGERFPFAAHHGDNWSLEHIHAQNSEVLRNEEEWYSWLALHRKVLADLPISDEFLNQRDSLLAELMAVSRPITNLVFQRLSVAVTDLLTATDQAVGAANMANDMHGIANLALLQSGKNSVLSNSAFEAKRQALLAMDKAGAYIPVCTRQVFLKYFGDHSARKPYFWSLQDREAYSAALENLLGPYLKAPV
ncbi:DUF262 domain-containing protein [Mesorhizobium sp. CO1-1-4]|uniref:DUF262 domain-containing protein n=1 Tax=Mesorhizobium sp. CO1-1-4 TaxID=2876633 RepID=UPI001CCE6E83|nr:DUF262 domain-containing protein [Mesorhizobium sp. CO1-1-4]MBZ9739942.1 DUF262 domain-containing protein [Mesorhizobium sp. CO1-1-4]